MTAKCLELDLRVFLTFYASDRFDVISEAKD
jgi:hypothetical protein